MLPLHVKLGISRERLAAVLDALDLCTGVIRVRPIAKAAGLTRPRALRLLVGLALDGAWVQFRRYLRHPACGAPLGGPWRSETDALEARLDLDGTTCPRCGQRLDEEAVAVDVMFVRED